MRFSRVFPWILALVLPVRAVVYDMTMTLHVPRVYDNQLSTGYRKYQTQRLKGTLSVTADRACATLENRTHKVAGKRVTYSCDVKSRMWNLVGSNSTGSFRTPSVNLSIEALPSYVPAFEPTDDETLVLNLAGHGTGSGKTIHGTVSGTLGCGCSWYGHVSPTRDMFTGDVVDKAAVWGRFRLRRTSP